MKKNRPKVYVTPRTVKMTGMSHLLLLVGVMYNSGLLKAVHFHNMQKYLTYTQNWNIT